MIIDNIETIEGATCIYLKCNFSDDLIDRFPLYNYYKFKSIVKEHGVVYSKTLENPRVNNGAYKCTSYWDWTFFYPNIYYIDGLETPLGRLDPASGYYLRVYCITTSGETIYSDVYKTYTTRRTGNPNSEEDNGGEEEGSPTGNNQCMNFELEVVNPTFGKFDDATKLILLRQLKKSYKLYRQAGYFMNWSTYYCKTDTSTASCGSGSGYNGVSTPYGYINFNSTSYMKLSTIYHEFGHFMEYKFREAQSNFTYPQYMSYGYILGKKLNYMSQFLTGNKLAKTKCHSGHVDPYVSYNVSMADEDKPLSQLLLRCMCLYQATMGYDGFTGTSNKDLIIPCYDLKEGTYYIKGYKDKYYYGVESNSIISTKDKLDDSRYKWIVTFVPASQTYIIKNLATNKYLTELGLSDNNTSIQACPTIFNTQEGDSYVIMKYIAPSTGWSRDVYNKSRIRLIENGSNITHSTNEIWNPKIADSNFIFEKIN